MTADVNVTEKVAGALCPSLWDDTYPEHLREGFRHLVREQATAALAALADPDVLAGIAGVLRDAEDEWVRRYADAEGAPPTRSELQAAAVVEWLRRRP